MNFADIFPMLVITFASSLVGHILKWILLKKSPPAEIDAAKVFVEIEIVRRREELQMSPGVGVAEVNRRAMEYARPRDELHELAVVNRLSEAQRARLEFERMEEKL